ncbi:MAG: FAD-binding oxidoreductase [Actinobacteria bacterium]|nr:FAD-binding oxidoreductase [Actinomycetota bacterium]
MRTSVSRGPATIRDRVRVVECDPAGSIENVGSVAALREKIINAPQRGLVLADGTAQRADWSTNTGGQRLRLVGPLAKPAVEWIDWDRQTARVTPGASVADTSAALLAKGWCLPVLSGDPRQTVAAVVSTSGSTPHQQRHLSLGNSLRAVELLDGNGNIQRLAPDDRDPRLFWGAVGGMGLLGMITSVELAIRPVSSGWVLMDSTRYDTLDEIVSALMASTGDRYCLATLDTSSQGDSVGRGSVLSARHARVNELPTPRQHAALTYEASSDSTASAAIPTKVLQTRAGRLFASMRHRSAPPRIENQLETVAGFFHRRATTPTSAPDESGWLNYDFCVPDGATNVLARFLEELRTSQVVALAATLTRVDAHEVGPLGWGKSGFGIHLALPTGNGKLACLLDSFDERIASVGGCVRLATDSRVRPDVLQNMYPRLDDWYAMRAEMDPHSRLQSNLARRLSL